MLKPYLIALCLLLLCTFSEAQQDSSKEVLQHLLPKYISNIDSKVEGYNKRITSKTNQTLEKLSCWEIKLHTILQKVNPEAAEKLFGSGQMTFNSLLQQIKQGETIALQYQQQYDHYRDNLATSLKYIEQLKDVLDSTVIKQVAATRKKMQEPNSGEDRNAAIQQFIKDRKKQLITTAFQYLGKNKYLAKMNEEAFYYAEAMKNYKELFRDEKKAEQTTKTILNKVPAFQKFIQNNSMMTHLFGQPGDVASVVNLSGLQTRASIQSLVQDRFASAGISPQQMINQNIQAAQNQMNVQKDKMLKAVQGNDTEIPEFDFKPKMVKTKAFLQRLEYGTNLQMAKSSNMMPSTLDLALTIGYQINNKSVAGIGAGYKIGLGTISNIRLSNEGISLRSFVDWKLKKQFFITGGAEMNYLSSLPVVDPLHEASNTGNWQQLALLGLTKKISVNTKWFKETKLQLLYDFLSKGHVPVSQPILFRIGYTMK